MKSLRSLTNLLLGVFIMALLAFPNVALAQGGEGVNGGFPEGSYQAEMFRMILLENEYIDMNLIEMIPPTTESVYDINDFNERKARLNALVQEHLHFTDQANYVDSWIQTLESIPDQTPEQQGSVQFQRTINQAHRTRLSDLGSGIGQANAAFDLIEETIGQIAQFAENAYTTRNYVQDVWDEQMYELNYLLVEVEQQTSPCYLPFWWLYLGGQQFMSTFGARRELVQNMYSSLVNGYDYYQYTTYQWIGDAVVIGTPIQDIINIGQDFDGAYFGLLQFIQSEQSVCGF